jgi:thymidylate kinase
MKGKFVVIVGPDGVGKTSVAAAFVARTASRYFHFRPPVVRPWGSPEPGEQRAKTDRRSGTFDSVGRLLVSFVRLWIGHLARVMPAKVKGLNVVADRWAYGYVVRPGEVRYSGPAALSRAMLRLLPRPDLVVCLVAPPALIHARKGELTILEIERDLKGWRSVPAPRLIEVDATQTPDEIAAVISRELTRPAGRQAPR